MTAAQPFTHRDNGTPEPVWLLDDRWTTVARLPLDTVLEHHPHVVLLAPHPDDETLGLGATLADLAEGAAAVTIVIATHGGCGPQATPRRTEAEHACAVLGTSIKTLWWDLPDGHLHDAVDEMVARLGDLIDARTLLFAPVECDGHSDHEALAQVGRAVAADTGAALLLYPVWLWHWATPADLDWTRLRTIAPSLRALRAKAAALECYTSQLTATDDHPIIGAAMRARAHRVIETVLFPVGDLADRLPDHPHPERTRDQIAAPFDAMLDNGVTDPWRLDDSDYERRRYALTLACLGRPHYRRVLEIGCATGQLAVALRQRADHVVGMDASDRALEVARARPETVEWLLGAAPTDIPDADFDLIVLSEVGYFLDGPELLATLRAVHRRLRPGGEIVIATWSAPTEQIPLDGPLVAAQAAAVFEIPLRAHYHDADLTIEVWGQPVSVHREYGGTT